MIKAIYSLVNGAVRIQDPSGQLTYSTTFEINRGSIQGDIYSPSLFTLALDWIFRLHDTHCEGIGEPLIPLPLISKLEYADDAALINRNAADASTRLSALSTGGSVDASLEISLKKTKAMPVRRYCNVSETLEEEVIEMNLPHKCPACGRPFPTLRGLKIHRARWCNPDGPVRSRKGSLTDKAVRRSKLMKQAAQMPSVSINGHYI